jgi:hypothetical protein
MNRSLKKEVNSLHPNKAGENKKKRDQLYYQQNKEILKAKQKERRAKKKTESKVTLTNGNNSENKTNVKVKKVQSKEG